ncbi:MAG: lipopolysaccharide biosynthesis protein [Roseateles asaccharophilus]|uniref:lipopolysaccharide biosynthesis protein n=1 Tax=Roseateles asaccharophilus TaxID=582607 RepID=UPI0039191466
MKRARTLLRRSFYRRDLAVGRQVMHGAAYQFVSIGLRTLITIGSTAILARLLLPADFGYVAMATVVTELAGLLGALGLSNVLVQRATINRLQLDTFFWASVGLGCALSAAVVLLSYPASSFFGDAKVGEILRVLGLNFILGSLSIVPTAVLSRMMRFGTEFWIQNTTIILRTLAAIAAAAAGWGAWSLVIGALAGSLISTVLYFMAVPYLPRLRFSRRVLTQSWRTSSGYLGNSSLYYLNTNLDLMLVGRALGATALGYYQSARSLTDEIRGRIAMPVQNVLFPAFSALQSDRPRFRALVMRAALLMSALVVPIGFGVSANADALVRTLYGTNWLAMVPVMQLFGLSASIRAATAIAAPLFAANDRVGLSFRYNLVGTIIMAVAVLGSTPWGVEGVSLAVAVSTCYAFVGMHAAFRLIQLGVKDMLKVLLPPYAAASVMWVATKAVFDQACLQECGALLQLMVQVGFGAMVYLAMVLLLSVPLRREVMAVLHRLWRN